MGFQLPGVGMQVHVAGTGNMDVGFLGRGDVGVAAAGDMNFGHARFHLAQVGIAGTGDVNFAVPDLTVGLDVAAAGDADLQPFLAEIMQHQIAATGNALANACGTRNIEADQPACATYCNAQKNTPQIQTQAK